MKKYDEIIGKVIVSLIDLETYVKNNESSKLAEVLEARRIIDKVDEFMAYGNVQESTTVSTHKAVESIISTLKGINVDGETMHYIIEQVGMEDQMAKQLFLNL